MPPGASRSAIREPHSLFRPPTTMCATPPPSRRASVSVLSSRPRPTPLSPSASIPTAPPPAMATSRPTSAIPPRASKISTPSTVSAKSPIWPLRKAMWHSPIISGTPASSFGAFPPSSMPSASMRRPFRASSKISSPSTTPPRSALPSPGNFPTAKTSPSTMPSWKKPTMSMCAPLPSVGATSAPGLRSTPNCRMTATATPWWATA